MLDRVPANRAALPCCLFYAIFFLQRRHLQLHPPRLVVPDALQRPLPRVDVVGVVCAVEPGLGKVREDVLGSPFRAATLQQ